MHGKHSTKPTPPRRDPSKLLSLCGDLLSLTPMQRRAPFAACVGDSICCYVTFPGKRHPRQDSHASTHCLQTPQNPTNRWHPLPAGVGFQFHGENPACPSGIQAVSATLFNHWSLMPARERHLSQHAHAPTAALSHHLQTSQRWNFTAGFDRWPRCQKDCSHTAPATRDACKDQEREPMGLHVH